MPIDPPVRAPSPASRGRLRIGTRTCFGYVLDGEMLCEPGKPMLTLVDEEELARRKNRRASHAN